MKKHNVWVLVWIFLVSCASLNACSENDDESTGSDYTATEDFLKMVSASDLFEITAGMMAEDQGESSEISSFGQKLVHIHTRTNAALEEIARRKGIQLPDEMTADRKSLVNRLGEKEGAEFDQAFAEAQITALQEIINLYEQGDKQITNPEVQGFINQILPVLREHLAEIQNVQTGLLNKK